MTVTVVLAKDLYSSGNQFIISKHVNPIQIEVVFFQSEFIKQFSYVSQHLEIFQKNLRVYHR